MADFAVDNFGKLHSIVEKYDGQHRIFRGVRSTSHLLVPKLGRQKRFHESTMPRAEQTMLRLFKEQAVPYLQFEPRDDWDWLAIAQHHGLPTRLLDWTRNPLVAAYFAVEAACQEDSVIYAFELPTFIKTDLMKDPFKRDKIGKFIPRHITPRITAQAGLFTIHPKPDDPLESEKIDRIILKNKFRRDLKHILYQYGIHHANMFPGLDGLAKHIEWLRTKVY
jgi:hypothetical protein